MISPKTSHQYSYAGEKLQHAVWPEPVPDSNARRFYAVLELPPVQFGSSFADKIDEAVKTSK